MVLSIYFVFFILSGGFMTVPFAQNIPTYAESPDGTLMPPVRGFPEQITLKPFGIFIDPENSPVQPERFRGYHTGVDVEVNEEDMLEDIPVNAVAGGTVLAARFVNGYGGAVAISHVIDGADYVAVYGHMNPDTLAVAVGDMVSAGQEIGELGDAYSEETDGERKHLHLSVHKGTTVDWRGYADTLEALEKWVDPVQFY